jgi:hypothetical protein
MAQSRAQMEEELKRLEMEEELARLEAEEASASESQEVVDSEEPESKFTGTEIFTRGVLRPPLEMATLGLSERALEAWSAASQMLSEGKLDEAKSLLDNFDLYQEREFQRQKEFKKEYPVATTTTGLLGGIVPGTPGAKLAVAGLKEGTKFAGRMAQAAVTSGVASGAMEAGETMAEGVPLPEAAKRIGKAAGIGFVAGPVIGATMEGTAQVVGRAMTSWPAQRLLQVITGLPVRKQNEYLKVIPEIEKMPDEASVIKAFGEIRNKVLDFSRRNLESQKQAESQLKELKNAIAEQTKTAKGEIKRNLDTATKELDRLVLQIQADILPKIKEELVIAQSAQQAQRTMETTAPPLRPEVDNVLASMSAIKSEINEASANAAKLIADDVFFDKRVLTNAYKEQIKKLKISETGGALGLPTRKSVEQLERELFDLEKELPERITGLQLKKSIQQLDKAFDALQPGQYGDVYENAIKGIRKTLDTELKSLNDDYRAAMEPVAEKAEFLGQLDEYFRASDTAKTSDQIMRRLKQAEKDPVLFGLLEKMEQQTGFPVTAPVQKLRQISELKNAPLPPLPQEQRIKDLKMTVDMAKAKNFEDQVFSSVQDQPMAQAIVGLKREIDKYTNPEFIESQIRQATAEGRISLEQAQKELAKLQADRAKMQKAITEIDRSDIAKPEDILVTLLRAPDKDYDPAIVTRMIDGITSLPDEPFKEIMERLLLTNQKQFDQFVTSLRLQESIQKPRTNGSRRTIFIRELFNTALGRFGAAAPGTIIGTSAKLAFGLVRDILGPVLDEFGGQVAKTYLRNAAQLQGIPTGSKYRSFATAPLTARIRNAIGTQIGLMAADIDPKQLYFMNDSRKAAVERDIKQSKMTAVERAKALNELNSLGGISGEYVRKIMLESMPPQSVQPMSEAIPALEADKPDMLQRLSKRTAREGVRGLQGIVQGMREA